MRVLTGLASSLLVLVSLASACVDGNGGDGGASPSPTAADRGSPSPTRAALGEGLSTARLVEELKPSVVQILSEAASLDIFGQLVPQAGAGTGFIIDGEGHIVTNNHVVVQPNTCDNPAQKITVTLSDGGQHTARIVGRDVPTDLAVLQIDVEGTQPAELGVSSDLEVGQDVVAIGNALNLPGGPTVTKGVVSAKGRLIEEQQCGVNIPDALQTDAAINPGNSGGPLVNMDGQVVGITTAVIRGEAEGIGLAISIDSAKPIIDDLIEHGQVERGFLGVRLSPLTPFSAASCGLSEDIQNGVVIASVALGGPAEGAGLQRCDVIRKVAGREIRNTGDLFAALTEHRVGETVRVEYLRGGRTATAEVTLG